MPETRGDVRLTGRRCLASTEIKNIDSHSHAGLHRGSIRFSPARQYPFFPRTVRGTNCSCIPPTTLTPPLPMPHRNPKHKGSLFHLAAPSLPSCLGLSLNPCILQNSPRVCARSSNLCDLSKCMET